VSLDLGGGNVCICFNGGDPMRVVVIVASMLVLTTPSEASKSCMTKAEAREHFGSVHIYWHGKGHCWDATSARRHSQIRQAQKKIKEPKWRKSMSRMLAEEEPGPSRKSMSEISTSEIPLGAEPVQSPWVNRWVDIESSQPAVDTRWVDIVQVAPPLIAERKIEPIVTPRGVVIVVSGITLTLAIVLFVGMIYERPTSRRNTRWAG